MKTARKAYPSTDLCQVCGEELRIGSYYYDANLPAIYNGKIHYQWAWACDACFKELDGRLGMGKGQQYNSETNEKTGG